MNILQGYRGGGKKIRIQRTSKKLTVAQYVRVSVKEPENQAAMPTVDLDKLLREDTVDGLYIPTQERFFRNPPDDDPSQAEFVLRDWLRQKAEKKKK
jgi:hypothetical protein